MPRSTRTRTRKTVLALCLSVATLGAAAPALAQPVEEPAPAPVVEVPAGIDRTGLRDVTAELNAFFAGVPDGSRVSLPAGAVYRIEAPLVIREKNDLVIEGNGAKTITKTRGDRTRQHWRIHRGSEITIKDVVVQGAHPAGGTSAGAYVSTLEAQHGFNVNGTKGLVLDGVTVTDVYGDFVYLGADLRTGWAEDVQVIRSTFARNGRQGFGLTGARRVLIADNSIQDTRRATFDLEPNGGTTGVEDVVITRNRIGKGRLNFISAVGAGPVNRVTVSDNVLRGRALNSTIGTDRERRHGWVITGNTTDTRYGSGGRGIIGFQKVDAVTVTGIDLLGQKGRAMHGVVLDDVCGAVVADNRNDNGAGQYRITTPCSLPG